MMGRVHVWETKPTHKRCKEIERLQQSRTEIETETTDTQKNAPLQNKRLGWLLQVVSRRGRRYRWLHSEHFGGDKNGGTQDDR